MHVNHFFLQCAKHVSIEMFFIFRVDHGGQAEAKGLKVGDQVLELNHENFQNISHGNAVDLLRKSSQLIMRIKVGNG